MTPSKPLAYYQEHYDALLEGLDGYLDTLRRLLYK
jgi:hypothetical protein